MRDLRLRRACIVAALPGMLVAWPILVHGRAAAATTVKELSPVTIHRTKNPGDLPYTHCLKIGSFLQSLLPPEPRVFDMRHRLSFTDLSGPARDDYLPDSWAVAIVGDTLDHTIAVEFVGPLDTVTLHEIDTE